MALIVSIVFVNIVIVINIRYGINTNIHYGKEN